MPEPLLYFKAMGTSALVSAVIALALLKTRCEAGPGWRNFASAVAISAGLFAGYGLLSLQLAWPPRNGLDRLLTIIIPLALCIEVIAAFQHGRLRVAWLLRLSLAAAVPRILLHDSVYLRTTGEWTAMQSFATLATCGCLLFVVWWSMSLLLKRGARLALPISICLAAQCAGATVMMAGYIKGGAAAIPLVATLLATAVVAWLVKKNTQVENPVPQIIVGAGVVSLFGILFVGKFFGRVSNEHALAMLFAPLLCWISELPLLRNRKPWMIAVIQLLAVVIPLTTVLFLSKQNFDRDMSPLLGNTEQTSRTGETQSQLPAEHGTAGEHSNLLLHAPRIVPADRREGGFHGLARMSFLLRQMLLNHVLAAVSQRAIVQKDGPSPQRPDTNRRRCFHRF
jgi:hypothetical protein